jgi:4-amino-4-deoxy-L-arabinose transferase-like glycosyltransferase
LGLGVLLRLIGLYLVSGLALASDWLSYHKVALQLVHKVKFHPFWPPGLPYYLSFFHYLFGESELVARACMILLYLMLSVFLFLLAKEMYNRKTANIAVLIFSVFPSFIYHSVTPVAQMPMAVILIAVAYFAIRSKQNISWICSIFLGLLLGIGVLVRPSSLLLLLFLPLYFVVTKRRFLLPSIMVISAILLVFLWIVKAYKMTGEFVMINSANSMNFFFGNNQWTPLYKTWWLGSHRSEDDEYKVFLEGIRKNPPSVQERLYKQHAIEHILSRPDLFLLRTLSRFRVYFAFDTTPGATLIKGYDIDKKIGLGLIMADAIFYLSIASLAILFLFLPPTMFGDRGTIGILIGIVIIYSLPYWVAFSHASYHFPVVPILGIFAVISGTRLLNEPGDIWRHITSSRRRKYLALFGMILFVYIQIEWIVMMYSRI